LSTAKLDQVVELWRKKGLRKGDVDAFDTAAIRGKSAARAGDVAELEAAIKAARQAVETTEIDKAFVSRKLARLNPVLEAMADGDVKTRIKELVREAVKLSQKGDPASANGKLNEAFSLAGR
jgi:ribosomal protein S20